MSDDFKILSDTKHIRSRFSMYGGSQVQQKEDVFVGAEFTRLNLVGGLLKVINEIIDNSVDEHVRTNKKHADKIDIKVDNDGTITVYDNGRGIPTSMVETVDGPEYQMVSAFTRARSGTNFDDSERESIGMNGVGSMITFVTSEKFEAWSCDGLQEVYLCGENGEVTKVTEKAKMSRGTTVKFKPDYEFFGLDVIDNDHLIMIAERIRSLALAFPSIKFTMNGKKVECKFSTYFGECNVFKTTKAVFGITKSNGSFQTHSIINGLSVKEGTHIEYFMNHVLEHLRSRIKSSRKLDITPARLKQHLRVHCVMNNFPNLKFDSQTKERVRNSYAECREAIGHFEAYAVAAKLMKDRDLIDEICAYTKLQADLAAKKELSKLEKKKKIKSDKFIDSIGKAERIFIVEGLSAMSGLMNCMGRKGNAFYALKGVPLNVIESSHAKFMNNTELSELYSIMTQYPDAEVCIATDADADGARIRGLACLFIWKFFPEYLTDGRLRSLSTPVAIAKKNNKLVDWAYSFADVNKLDMKLDVQYQKGLGSWSEVDLREIMKQDTLEAMLPIMIVDDETIFENWFSEKTSQFRKDQILVAAPFDVMRI